ncbi:MAG: OprD family outer membrane porin [Deltaproteobacteria bacterium]|nr:OprD family outer membrane porin [Deltaproteobacteria bacterium]
MFAWRLTGQHLKQDDIGESVGGPVDTHMYGIEAGIETHGFEISLVGSVIGDDDIIYPWGHDFLVSAVVCDLYQAEGKGWRAVLVYDYSEIGIPGLIAKVAHAQFNTPDRGNNAGPDVNETDFDLRYKFKGTLDGTGIRARYGVINQDKSLGGEDYTDMRMQLTYDFEF